MEEKIKNIRKELIEKLIEEKKKLPFMNGREYEIILMTNMKLPK